MVDIMAGRECLGRDASSGGELLIAAQHRLEAQRADDDGASIPSSQTLSRSGSAIFPRLSIQPPLSRHMAICH
jgi:hypothetical protein